MTDLLKTLRRRFCRHSFTWSERRRCEVCIKCGQTREAR